MDGSPMAQEDFQEVMAGVIPFSFFHQQACRATLGLTWGLEHQALGTSLLLCIETSAKADWEWHWSRLELSNFSTCCYNTESFQCEVDWNKIV